MSDQTPQPKRQGAGRAVKIALAVSLAVNLAVAGLIGGALLGGRDRSGDGDGGAPALHTLGLGPFALALPREDRSELRGRIEEQGAPLREERRALGRAMREVQQALLADPFDRAAAEAAFSQSRDRVIGLQEAGHTALLDQIETMSVEERAALAESLNRVMRRFGTRR